MTTLTAPSKDYSQHGEQMVLVDILDRLPVPDGAQYLDIGAFDGVTLSNTAALHEMGWRGVCVEPCEEFANQCAAIRGERCVVMKIAAIATEHQRTQMILCKNPCANAANPCTSHLMAYRDQIEGTVEVDAMRVDRIANSIDDLFVVSIDTEGTELDLLRILNRNNAAPPVVLCEVNYQGHIARKVFGELGYRIVKGSPFGGINWILIRDDYADDVDDLLEDVTHEPKSSGVALKMCAIMSVPRYGSNLAHSVNERTMFRIGIPKRYQTGAYWDRSIHQMLEDAVEQGLDAVLTLDYDSVVHEDIMRGMLKTFAENPHMDALAALQPKRSRKLPLFNVVPEDDRIEFDDENGPQIEIGDQPFQVATAHFGCTLIRISALRRVPKPWMVGEPGPGGTWKEFYVDPDIDFWLRWTKAGNNIYVDPKARIGHVCEAIVWYDENLEMQTLTYPEWRERHPM